MEGYAPNMNGIVQLNSDFAQEVGFVSKYFDSESYLWRKDDTVFISLIISRHQGRGNVRRLINRLLDKGFVVKVPAPFPRMRMICESMKFELSCEDTDAGEPYECWIKKPCVQ